MASIGCLALPECTLSKSAAAAVKRYVTTHVKGATSVSAPVSAVAATVTESFTDIIDSDPYTHTKKGGVTVLLGPRLAPFLLTPPRPFAAGRGLLLELTLPDSEPFYILALYGVSSADSTPDKLSWAADLAHELRVIFIKLEGKRSRKAKRS